ncbi:MAG: ABC transporter ATP-binding protein, partial [Candidatus Brocadiae bacterium]|nr:ABC transporter ATP-binding protein [Candidatus Brocadiia bacterium]
MRHGYHYGGHGPPRPTQPITWETLKSVGRLLVYIRPYLGKVALLIFLTVLGTGLNLINPQLFRLLLDKVVTGTEPEMLPLITMAFIAIVVLRSLGGYVHSYVGALVGNRIVRTMRNQLYEHLQRLSLRFFEDRPTGEIMSRIVNDTQAVQRAVVYSVETVIRSVLTLVGVVIILFSMNSTLALYTFIPIPLFVASAVFYSRMLKPLFRAIREKIAALNTFLQERISGVRIVKSFAREDMEQEAFEGTTQDVYRTQMKAALIFASIMPSMTTVTSVGMLMIIFVGGRMASRGAVTAGELVAFILYLGFFYRPIGEISRLVGHEIPRALAAAERIFEFLDETQKLPVAPDAIVPDHLRGEIALRNVTFSYGEDVVLKDINLEISAAETIALVGPSGVGKTTLVDLISRLYEVEHGDVTVDGISVKQYEPRGLRRHIGVVLQEPFLFNTSIKENIAYGKPEATDEEIRAAAVKAEAHDFIRELPKGYDTAVGERGVKLSVGQKQRISIARALLKDPAILILDEATSSVDAEAEYLIQQAL